MLFFSFSLEFEWKPFTISWARINWSSFLAKITHLTSSFNVVYCLFYHLSNYPSVLIRLVKLYLWNFFSNPVSSTKSRTHLFLPFIPIPLYSCKTLLLAISYWIFHWGLFVKQIFESIKYWEFWLSNCRDKVVNATASDQDNIDSTMVEI